MWAQLKPMRYLVIATAIAAACLLDAGRHIAVAHHSKHHDLAARDIPVRQLLDIYECSRCHRLTTPHRLIGPSLWELGKRTNATAVRASLLNPNAIVTTGFPNGLMKKRLQEVGFYSDIARNPAILDRIVAYLIDPPAPSPAASSASGRPSPALAPSPSAPDDLSLSIDVAAVTKMQFAAFIADGGYHTKRYWDRIGWSVAIRRRNRQQPLGWQAERDTTSREPLVGTNWYEADAYCRWLGKTLPTVQEWERACVEMPTWSDAPPQSELEWEWTADAIWKAGRVVSADESADPADSRDHCTKRVTSHRALDGRRTGFRCRSVTRP